MQDQREERSPSFFNPEEVVTVMDYVKMILSMKKNPVSTSFIIEKRFPTNRNGLRQLCGYASILCGLGKFSNTPHPPNPLYERLKVQSRSRIGSVSATLVPVVSLTFRM
jgi:hypothetical protein